METYLVWREHKCKLIIHRERNWEYLHPWNWPENFQPIVTLTLWDWMRSEVLERVANQRYASCLREAQARREDTKN